MTAEWAEQSGPETERDEELSRATARIERLAWLACRDEMERHSKRCWETLARLLGARGSEVTVARDGRMYPSVTSQLTRNDRALRLGVLQFAVNDIAQTLSKQEQAQLRATGQLPDWFIDAAVKRAKTIRREMSSSR